MTEGAGSGIAEADWVVGGTAGAREMEKAVVAKEGGARGAVAVLTGAAPPPCACS